jgi:hypothetical protein
MKEGMLPPMAPCIDTYLLPIARDLSELKHKQRLPLTKLSSSIRELGKYQSANFRFK